MEKTKFKVYEFAKRTENLEQLKNELLESLEGLRLDDTGIFYASTGDHYILKSWSRDNFYANIPFLLENPEYYKQTAQTMLDFYHKMEREHNKISWLIKDTDVASRPWRFLHPRLTKDLEEIPGSWAFLQVDSVAMTLYSVYLGESNGIKIIRDEEDRKLIQLIIDMLQSIKADQLNESGAWEERLTVMTSTQGILLASMVAMKLLKFDVPQDFIDRIHENLNKLLPQEAEDRECDLAQLSLMFFQIIDPERARMVIRNIEKNLKKIRGINRYRFDAYYNTANHYEAKLLGRYYDKDNFDYGKGEAEWSFGYAFLALSFYYLNEYDRAKEVAYEMIERTIIHNVELPVIDKKTGLIKKDKDGNVVTYIAKSVVPEIYYAGTDIPNDNTLLSWSNALAIEVINKVLLGK